MYGQRIKELRKEKNLTQKQLADILGIRQQYISRFEREEGDLNTSLLIQICEFFDVSTDYLLGKVDY